LTMTWLWPKFANGPARYTNSLNSELPETIGYSPGAGSDCKPAVGGTANRGATGRGRGAAHAAKLSTRTAVAILLNI